MQGKLDSSQSRSTSLVRLFTRSDSGSFVCLLLLNRQFYRGGSSGYVHGLCRRLAVLAPCFQSVLAGGNVFDFEVAVLIGDREIRSRANDHIARHLRVHVAKQGCYTYVIKLERLLLTLRPGTHVVRQLFV